MEKFVLPEQGMVAMTAGLHVYAIKDRLIAVIIERLRQYTSGDGLKLPAKADFLAAAKDAFRRYVISIDIPGIGPIVEQALDEAMEAAFMKLVEALYDRFAAV